MRTTGVVGVTVSMRVMSAGDGYRYLLKTVAAGDGNRDLSTPLTRYYQEKGAPPGYWIGSGLSGLGDGGLVPGCEVTDEHLRLLLGAGCDPLTGEPLGKARLTFKTAADRIDARVRDLPAGLGVVERAEAITLIESEEDARDRRRAVAGFDYTFSVPKSVSTVWAVADGATQGLIVQAHHDAVAEVIGMLEREVAMTRVGVDAGGGSVAQVEVRGVVATAYDHYDSRSSDPQLHTHVVVANKVQGAHDGRWRTLDGRPMHAAVVALSEHYNAILADHLTRDLGLGWEMRERGERRNPAFEIVGVPDELIHEFSSRSRDIEVATDGLIEEFVDKHGRRPSGKAILRLRAEATLMTRAEKTVHSLADLTAGWRERASVLLGQDSTTWATRIVADSGRPALLRADELSLEMLEGIGHTVVAVVGQKRSTWRRWNLHAEASRQLMGVRFVSTVDREAALGLVVDAAEQGSIRITPPELATSPVVFQRPDGSSVFRPKHGTLFTSTALLAAEDRLLDLAHTTTARRVDAATVEKVTGMPASNRQVLSADQREVIGQIVASGRVVDVLVGPAGTGKTTMLGVLRAVWEAEYGRGSVAGLAPSAAAAKVLAEELGIATENTAKWVHAHTHNGWALTPGQLLIVDEASLAGTFTLDTLATHAAKVGAKVLLVGDWAQLSAVDAGGAFGMIARDRDRAPELSDVRRFRNEWEKTATLALRIGDSSVIDTYLEHHRVVGGDLENTLATAYGAWWADLAQGRVSVMIAETVDTVRVLNERARLDRMIAGKVSAIRPVNLHDETQASRGDLVITRKNNRTLTTGKAWVKNGDRWIITATHSDGSVSVRRAGRRVGGAVRLPARYVAENVELAYALTVYRAQGSTVDTAHAVVHSSSMTRETFYVSMTRGRDANTCYVATDQAHLEEHQHFPDDEVTVRGILARVLGHEGAQKSAHEAIVTEHNSWAGIAHLAAEYETIADVAQHKRWVALVSASGLNAAQARQVVEAESFGPLTAEFRRAEAHHHNPGTLLPRLVTARDLSDADDIGAVLRHRLQRATATCSGTSRVRPSPRLIAGLIPEATGDMPAEMRTALKERKHLIEDRATTIAETATKTHEPWTRALGEPPTNPRQHQVWLRHVRTVAAYRDRYNISGNTPIGKEAGDTNQRLDAERARVALRNARRLGGISPAHTPSRHAERTQDRSQPTL
ncbi:MobF family relaxase [Lacisediminihabitans sp. H27-G8]|uniref:MobF family relaxase n=1 Tax=Lacisediminihabitans sp. H27-G8 TaxID=3111909 RepID=UPI0038FD0B2C